MCTLDNKYIHKEEEEEEERRRDVLVFASHAKQ